jgi:ketosteroid isomerase-like protein
MSDENVEIATRAFAEFQAGLATGNPAAPIDAGLIAPGIAWIVPTAPGLRPVYRGREEFIEFMHTWTEDFDWSIELDRVIDAGNDRVVVISHQRAAGKASGVPVELHMGALWELEGGQVIRIENFFDPADALKAAGLSE